MDGKLTIRPTTGTVQSLRTSGLITRLIAICWDSLLTRYGSYDETDIFQTGTSVHYLARRVKRLGVKFLRSERRGARNENVCPQIHAD